jgi:predicted phosphodiesterase
MTKSKRLSRALKAAKVIPFDQTSRIVLMSDCHRGDGSWGDDFSNNQNLFFAALSYYFEHGFTYIELGDGDELWENRNIKTIIDIHSDAFWLMSQFYQEGRFHMIYGNHDIVKRDPRYSQTNCETFYCDSAVSDLSLFPGLEITEGILLKYKYGDNQIFLTHGHQVDCFNSTFWRLARFLVRYVWRPLQLTGVRDPTSASKNYNRQNKIEKRLVHWSDKNKQMLICGHTHRPVFPKAGSSLYFNDGSCVHPRCITAIEIYNGFISLVKWATMTTPERLLYVGREVLEGPVRLNDYFKSIPK